MRPYFMYTRSPATLPAYTPPPDYLSPLTSGGEDPSNQFLPSNEPEDDQAPQLPVAASIRRRSTPYPLNSSSSQNIYHRATLSLPTVPDATPPTLGFYYSRLHPFLVRPTMRCNLATRHPAQLNDIFWLSPATNPPQPALLVAFPFTPHCVSVRNPEGPHVQIRDVLIASFKFMHHTITPDEQILIAEATWGTESGTPSPRTSSSSGRQSSSSGREAQPGMFPLDSVRVRKAVDLLSPRTIFGGMDPSDTSGSEVVWLVKFIE